MWCQRSSLAEPLLVTVTAELPLVVATSETVPSRFCTMLPPVAKLLGGEVIKVRSIRVAGPSPGPVAPRECIQNMMVPCMELKSALAARVICCVGCWLSGTTNCITPLREIGVAEVSAAAGNQIAELFTPLCGVPEGLESTMTLPTGAASKLKRTTRFAAPTKAALLPEEKPMPVTASLHELSLNGSVPPFHASPSRFPPLATAGTRTRAAAPVLSNVTLLETSPMPKETFGTCGG